MVTEALFFAFAAIAVLSAVSMIFQRNPIYACLWLVLSFFGLAGLYVLMGAPFIAAIQIIVYAGAIMVLFLFVIMLLNLSQAEREKPKRPRILPFAVVAALMLFAELMLIYRASGGRQGVGAAVGGETTVEEIGKELFTRYLYPFELSSVLILAAIVGAVMLAKKKV